MKPYVLLLIVLGLVLACSPADRQRLSLENTESPITLRKESLFKGQWEYDSLVQVIDSSTLLTEFYSLEYSDTHQNNRCATGKLNAKNAIVKLQLEETYAKGMQVITRFYYSGDLLFYAQQLVKDYQKKNNGFLEITSYFGSNKKVIISASRIGNDEEELYSKIPVVCKKTNFDPQEALNVVNQQGPYETRFQGSLETENLKFMIVGTKGNPTAQSAIAYNKDFPLAVHIVENEQQYLNRLLKVEFTKVTESNGFTFQGLTRIKLLDDIE